MSISADTQRISTAEQVALYLPSLAGGGAERKMLHIAKGMIARGVMIDLVLARREGALLPEIPAGAEVIDLNAHGTAGRIRALATYLKQRKPGALISMLDNVNVACWARTLARTTTPVVQSLENHVSNDLADHVGWKAWLKPWLMARCFRWCDGIVAASRGVAEDFCARTRMPLSRVRVIYNPIVTPEVIAAADADVDHPFFSRSSGIPVIVGAGRLEKQKDFSTLLRAFAHVRASRKARLLIIGEGSQRQLLQRLAVELGLSHDDVSMPGFVQNPHAVMAKGRLFVLSSTWEGFGNVIAEALAAGTPVVSTDCPSGPAEILEQGRYGRLAPVGDVRALAGAIEASLDEVPDREALRRRGMHFTADSAVEAYLDELRRACQVRRGAASRPLPLTAVEVPA